MALEPVIAPRQPLAPGTPYTQAELSRYTSAILDALGLKAGDVVGVDVDHPLLEPLAEELAVQAAERDVKIEVLLYTQRDCAEKTQQLLSQSSPLLRLRSPFTPPPPATAPDALSVDPFAGYEQAIAANQVRWSVALWPTPTWAQLVYPELDPDAAYRQLGRDLLSFTYQLDSDPPDAFNRHIQQLQRRAERINELELRGISLLSPLTKLHMRLVDDARFLPAAWKTNKGEFFCANLPTEEIFVTPDPESVCGEFYCTRPLSGSRSLVTGVRGRFEQGRLVDIQAADPAQGELLRQCFVEGKVGPNMERIGELGLVSQENRLARRGRVYYNGILDENTGTHFGLGHSYDVAGRGNQAPQHVDLIVGDKQLSVIGHTADGKKVTLIRRGRWVI